MPLLTPRLSSLWIGLVTPVDVGVARPLIEGLATETVVRDPSGMELFEVEPTPLPEAMRAALAEDEGRAESRLARREPASVELHRRAPSTSGGLATRPIRARRSARLASSTAARRSPSANGSMARRALITAPASSARLTM